MAKLIGTQPNQVPVNGLLGKLAFQDIISTDQISDGAGSGLDADLLDGQHGSYYLNASNINAGTIADARLPARLGTVAQSITDWNTATSNGWYMASGAANAPETGSVWFIGNVENHGAAGWCTQTVHAFLADTSNDTKTYRRDFNNGAWSAWYRLRLSQAEQSAIYLNASNINTGTLDAARIPNLDAGKITTGTLGADRLPATISGTKTFTSTSTKFEPTSGNAGLEIGALGVSSTPHIDFHTGATTVDYDTRIMASGGNGQVGRGILSYTADSHNFISVDTGNNINKTSFIGNIVEFSLKDHSNDGLMIESDPDSSLVTFSTLDNAVKTGVFSINLVKNNTKFTRSVENNFVNLGSGTVIDLAAANYFAKTITANTTFTLSNIPTSGTAYTFTLELTNAGAYAITFWSGVKISGGGNIVLTAAGRDRLFFTTRDGGTNWDLAIMRDIK